MARSNMNTAKTHGHKKEEEADVGAEETLEDEEERLKQETTKHRRTSIMTKTAGQPALWQQSVGTGAGFHRYQSPTYAT